MTHDADEVMAELTYHRRSKQVVGDELMSQKWYSVPVGVIVLRPENPEDMRQDQIDAIKNETPMFVLTVLNDRTQEEITNWLITNPTYQTHINYHSIMLHSTLPADDPRIHEMIATLSESFDCFVLPL